MRAQVFDVAGTKLGTEFLITPASDQYQEQPSMAALSNGEVVLAWSGRAQPGSDNDIYAQILTLSTDKPPTANEDDFVTNEDTVLLGGNVLANDDDADGGTLTATLESSASHGTLTLAPNGSFDYTPHPNFSGIDSFTYRAVNEAGESEPATVTIAVHPIDDEPVAEDDTILVPTDRFVFFGRANRLENDSDADGDILTVSDVAGARNFGDGSFFLARPGFGVMFISPDGGLTYAGLNFGRSSREPVTFEYEVMDSTGGTDTAVVSLLRDSESDGLFV